MLITIKNHFPEIQINMLMNIQFARGVIEMVGSASVRI